MTITTSNPSRRPSSPLTRSSGICIVLMLCLVVSVAGCADSKKGQTPNSELKVDMLHSYQAAQRLYEYVWNTEQFRAPKYKNDILFLIDKLRVNFHRVSESQEPKLREPGMALTLVAFKNSLDDLRQRFAEGESDYALWRLRGLTSGCIACHSRHEVKADFWGASIPPSNGSLEEQFGRATFLLATRQFDSARKELLTLASTLSKSPSGGYDALRALKLWLVIEVRVKENFKRAASSLVHVMEESSFSSFQRDIIEAWLADLHELQQKPLERSSIAAIKRLLETTFQSRRILDDEMHLVKTLYATALLHEMLEEATILKDTQGEALYLLAAAYTHTPITQFEVYSQLYLERCIREFPNSEYAKKAFQLYQENILFQNSGSSGLHLEADQEKQLKELRELAGVAIPKSKKKRAKK